MLAREKAVLGFYITRHPLAAYEAVIRACATARIADLGRYGDGVEVVIGGMITSMRTVVTKSGRNPGSRMGVVTVEDLSGRIEAILFPDDLTKHRALLNPDAVVFLVGEVDRRRETPSLRVRRVLPRADAVRELSDAVVFTVSSEARIEAVANLVRRHRGGKAVYLRVATSAASATPADADLDEPTKPSTVQTAYALLEAGRDFRVDIGPDLLKDAAGALDAGDIAVLGSAPRRTWMSLKDVQTALNGGSHVQPPAPARLG